MFGLSDEEREERKKKYGNLAKALKMKHGDDKEGRIIEILKTQGAKGLPHRDISQTRGRKPHESEKPKE